MNTDEEQTKRIAILKQIRDEEYDGVQARMASKLEVQPDYLSRVLNGGKGFTSDLARVWEKKLGKPSYYLDGVSVQTEASTLVPVPPSSVEQHIRALSQQVGELVQAFLQASPDARKVIMASARRAIAGTGKIPAKRGSHKT